MSDQEEIERLRRHLADANAAIALSDKHLKDAFGRVAWTSRAERRRQYACAALTGLLARPEPLAPRVRPLEGDREFAAVAFEFADAMLEAEERDG